VSQPALTASTLRFGALLGCVGGYLDAYTYVAWGGVFANSQSGNVVLLGVHAARGEWVAALRFVPSIAAFVVGVFVAESLQRPRVAAVVRWPFRAALLLEVAVLAIVGALPKTTPSGVVTVMISFVSSLQVTTFRTLVRWPYSSTMTTGNLRTATQAIFAAIVDRDAEAIERACAFGIVIFGFFAGATVGAIATLRLGVASAWCAAGLLASGLGLFVADERAA
jgi:uncharacterized membrane protein YoaK (UPF0700 family)